MPYNTAPIHPRKEPTGQAQLPLARVKKIIALDAEISMCSTHAAFVMTLAAEMFIQFLAEQGHRVAKSEKKPRRNIQYADIANAVQRCTKTEFLTDVVPRTTPYKKIVERRAKEEKAAAELATLQPIVDGEATSTPLANGAANGTSTAPAPEAMEDVATADPNAQLEREMEIRAQSEKTASAAPVRNTNGHSINEDIEMAD